MACNMEQRDSSFQKFCEALALKSEQITTELKAFYEEAARIGALKNDRCVSESFVRQLQEKYGLFPTLFEEVLHGAEVIRQDAYYLQYTNLLRLCVKNKETDKFIPFIQAEKDNVAAAFAPLFAVLFFVDEAEEEMCKRGIPQEMRLAVHKAYEKMLLKQKTLFGFTALAATYYFWSRHYLRPDIYPIGNLEFEITELPADNVILEHVADGTVLALREWKDCGALYEGQLILRGGLTGKEQKKQAEQSAGQKETRKPCASKREQISYEKSEEMVQLTKSEYRLCLQPGDDILSVHIPRNARIDQAHYCKDYQDALEFFAKYYPEKKLKAITCHSWLMDPELRLCVRDGSNIMDFQHYYRVCPAKSSGKEVFSFVFYKPVQSYEELPENTSLERALKARYLQDKPIYAYFGVHMLTERKDEK